MPTKPLPMLLRTLANEEKWFAFTGQTRRIYYVIFATTTTITKKFVQSRGHANEWKSSNITNLRQHGR